MAMTNAERMKKYREKLKNNKVKHEEMKAKARVRNNSIRTKLTGASLAEFREKNKIRQRKFRGNKKKCLIDKSSSSFKSRQSFGKALKRLIHHFQSAIARKKLSYNTLLKMLV